MSMAKSNCTLTFDGDNGERIIGSFSSYDEAWDAMMKFCDEHHFTVYYIRCTHHERGGVDDVQWCDVGSHTEFFNVWPADAETVQIILDSED